MRKPISPEEAERRLNIIFPRAAFDTVLSSPLAATAITALIHIDAVCNIDDDVKSTQWARPTTVLWMSESALEHNSDCERKDWRAAAAKNHKHVVALHESWGVPFQPLYRDNSRETLRDETFREWREHGAMRRRVDLPTSSSRPCWSLLDHFADLFDPSLSDEAVAEAAQQWRDKHLDKGARLKANLAIKAETQKHAVRVELPNSGGATRDLVAGISSLIIKGVIETWSQARMITPIVLAISEPGDKVHFGDVQLLQTLGIKIDAKNVLPDVLMADAGSDPVRFWIIEAVATDGAVTTARRRALLKWADQQGIKADRCSFLTAFWSRNDGAARKRLKDLASGTWAWFADEPHHELAWYQVVPSADEP